MPPGVTVTDRTHGAYDPTLLLDEDGVAYVCFGLQVRLRLRLRLRPRLRVRVVGAEATLTRTLTLTLTLKP